MYTKLYKKCLRPKLFARDPEDAHDHVTALLEKISRSRLLCALLSACLTVKDKRLARTRMGITFPNPVGLAAGFSKYGVGLEALESIGFGFLDLGGVTPFPQEGNPKKRMFRCEENGSLINRMGFNNPGATELIQSISHTRDLGIPVGINLGKGKETALENAADDYCSCLERLYIFGDFFTLNVSSPNTPGLRTLQSPEALNQILSTVAMKKGVIVSQYGQRPKPILVKIAPDMEIEMLDRIIECIIQNGMDGMVVANTTTSRPATLKNKHVREAGGLSGKPLFYKALSLVSHTKARAPQLTVIGVGGIFSAQDAWYMIHQAHADLIQVYTGLVYEGPGLVRKINKGLLTEMNNLGISSLEDIK